MHMYLDGNNMLGVFGRDRAPEHITWLIKKLEREKGKRSITVVFDGNQPPGDFAPIVPGLNIVFQDPDFGDADDEITRLVSLETNKGMVSVATNDRELRFRVANEGVHKQNIMSIEEFDALLNPHDESSAEDIDEAAEKEDAFSQEERSELEQELLKAFTDKSR